MLVEATYLSAAVVVPRVGCSFLNAWILCGIYISSCQEDDENYFSRVVEWLTHPESETAVHKRMGGLLLRLGELSDCLDALAAGTAQAVFGQLPPASPSSETIMRRRPYPALPPILKP